MPKRNQIKKSVEGDVVTFDFPGEGKVYWDLNEFSKEMQRQLMLHGIKAKGGDVYAGAKNVGTAMKLNENLKQQLLKGEWSVRGTGVGPRPTPLVRALAKAVLDNEGSARGARALARNVLEGDRLTRGTGVGAPRYTQLMRAVARAMKATGREPDMDKVAAGLLTKKQKEMVLRQPRVALELKKVKAEDAAARARASPAGDVDEAIKLFKELGLTI